MGFVVSLAAVFAASLTAPPGGRIVASASPAQRLSGAAATVTVSARIIRASARIGSGYGPPAPRMVPRRASVTAADGRSVPALVYDFE